MITVNREPIAAPPPVSVTTKHIGLEARWRIDFDGDLVIATSNQMIYVAHGDLDTLFDTIAELREIRRKTNEIPF